MPAIISDDQPSPIAHEAVPIKSLNPDAQKLLMRPSSSRSQRQLQMDINALRQDLEATGMLKPATIINFNPVPLVQEGLIKITVPQAGFHETVARVDWVHEGHTYVGHALTVRTPIMYAATAGWETDPQTLTDVPTHKPHHILPVGIAYSFLEHYSLNAKDSPRMGGVLIFEGEVHAIRESHLARTNNKVRVPAPVTLANGQRTFRVEERDIDELAAELFTMQAAYADFRIQSAHSMWTTNDPIQQKQITDVDRIWARFALEHNMIDSLPEWVRAKLLVGSSINSVVRCPVCSKPKTFQNIYLCPDCRAPYNTVEAVMAGMPVPQQYLEALEGEELEMVAAELERRQSRFKAAMAKAKKDAKTTEGDSN